ncbi:secretory phospholipase A2 receptor isoform X2 [Tribolium castaneum]|uniref:Secretory phospholipase A2 receptor-like Protein n=1 Tax=Tribolium castaneum TaxID=7070 RepID=A0A139WHP5_TRICA|nr:PREDICTED: secretory phospholipase A2 receptor isoform X2 [Tribolium castaneum]KYB27520.1 Secretory phospholipase A2 receptor-like Protein [Tribolium castaneum]|eukprot:XP_008199327.1 PREDICTED: secretory phospholipase A2 receptor isoform X2 [Tribolium castaneum]
MVRFSLRSVLGVAVLLVVGFSETQSQFSYVCPRKFVAIGRKCYYFSKDETIWHDAHFKCRNLNSSLATIKGPQQELSVRRYLNRRNDGRFERWLGGRYNEKQSRWVWGENGKPLVFHGFSRMNANDRKWAWHCIIVDPTRQNKWSARSCVERKRYICQRAVIGKRNIIRRQCTSAANNTSSQGCLTPKVGSSAPAFLIRKPQKPTKPYHVTTFVCPSHMILVGRKCYFFSMDKASWSNAYWACRDNKTKLAVITTKMQDNILRGFLKWNFTGNHERWLGGIFDWKQQKWKWAMSGKAIRYKNFAKEALVGQKNNTHHCITIDPYYNNLWNSKNRLEEKHYICQAKSKSVVKYDKLWDHNASVVIQPEGQEEFISKKSKQNFAATSSSPLDFNNEVTDKYVYN